MIIKYPDHFIVSTLIYLLTVITSYFYFYQFTLLQNDNQIVIYNTNVNYVLLIFSVAALV